MVFYRKYRPQTISELDSEELREKLYSVLRTKNTFHAFLFAGPKGLGKTSTARIVAKVINCEKSPKEKLKVQSNQNIEPCNECQQCTSITNGSNLDVLEIDGASNRGIDEIRDLREKIRLAPASARRKVYIIDEVHMLTTDAFNALLKTLEEPPDHAMFIFCTTEEHKVPETIASRCFVISFKKATDKELIHSFERIAKSEGIEIKQDALKRIAYLSDGSFRDGAKILEEITASAKGKEITAELVDEVYKISNVASFLNELFDFLLEKNAKEALRVVSLVVKQGTDMRYFLEQILLRVHQLLLVAVGIEEKSKSNHFTIEDIKQLAFLFTRAHQELKYAVLPQLPIELAIIEWSLEISENAPGPVRSSFPHSSQSSSGQAASAFTLSKAKGVVGSPPVSATPRMENKQIWEKLITAVKSQNHLIAGVLRGCSFKGMENGQLIIEALSQFHKDKLSEEKTLLLLNQVAAEVTGKKQEVLIELKER